MLKDKETVEYLNYLAKTYEAVTKTIAQTKQRLLAINPDCESKNDDIVKAMESIKGKLSRKITKQLEYWPIWSDWMKKVPGCGPAIASKLIILYYYRFVPICKKCGGDLEKIEGGMKCKGCSATAKNDGLLDYRLGYKYFPKVSSWWHYMGVHCDADGRKPRRKKGVQQDWNSAGRAIAFQLGEQFIKQKSEYRNFFDSRKAKREQTHPEASKMHKNNMARNETAKLFLSHFIQVAKEIEGEEFTKPYAQTLMGHTNILKPFYFEPEIV
jgi:hypothetical protein